MADINYSALGFKCGLEIHRRLKTKKLFCNCETEIEEAPKSEIKRKLRAVAGELGEIDPAALHELARGKEFIYKIYPKSSCLVEMDEEPPHSVNSDALQISLLVAKMLSAKIPEELHFMRKTVIDGSNTSGFQRTAIVGIDGNISTSLGDVGITNISLEEESCQILETRDKETVFGLDRLGIPLVEIGTAPDIKSPEHAKETAEKIGMLLKSTGKVMRGIGTIRQDVNVSIKGGARTEIKGAQDLKMIPELVRQEVLRQLGLLRIKRDLGHRNFRKQEAHIFDATSVFKTSQSKILAGKQVYAVKIEGISGLFREPLNDLRTLGSEVAGYTRTKAKIRGIIHSDEDLSKYGIGGEFKGLGIVLGAKDLDLVAIVAADRKTAEKALNAVVQRVNLLLDGLPKETRRALPDGDSEFMRPLPGAARMYPETDVAPVEIPWAIIQKIKLPETLDKKMARLQKKIGKELAKGIVASEYLDLFEEIDRALQKKYKAKDTRNYLIMIKYAADIFVNKLPASKRNGMPIENIPDKMLYDFFVLPIVIAKERAQEFFERVAMVPHKHYSAIKQEMGFGKLTAGEWQVKAKAVIERNKNVLGVPNAINKIMGEAMKELKGEVDGGVLAEFVKAELRKYKK